MSLAPGREVLHYRIVEKLGEGGMGQVWRAVDTTLDRDVAIKVLPEAFVADAERLARFEQEARLLASLNHPNIAAVYSVHEVEGQRFLAMEMVEGEDLAVRLARGRMPVEDAARLAVQIAEALEVAHDSGVIHRDLKPANIVVTPAGKAKVLDFGLAKALAGPESGDPSLSPTMTSAGTLAGMIMGTAAYMSPEQARGQEVDRRADVWAFGVVLFEMLTGKTGFAGQTVSDTLASVLKSEPDWDALPDDTPLPLRRLLRRCLIKDAERRLPHVGAARLELREWLDGAIEEEAPVAVEAVASTPTPMRWLPWSIVAVLAIVAAVAYLRPGGAVVPVTRPLSLMAQIPAGLALGSNQMGTLALSPDGRTLAVVLLENTADEVLYLRDLEGDAFRRVDNSAGVATPFFSPDGQWVGFFADGKIKKIHVQGGAPVNVCDVDGANRGASWGADDQIVFSKHYTEGLSTVSAAGGEPRPLTTLDTSAGERSHRWPQVVPGGDVVLFTVGTQDSPENYDSAPIDALRLSTGERKTIWKGASFARYVPSGHLVFAREGFLFAVRFDIDALEATGKPVPVLENVMGVSSSGLVHADFSRDGLLVYVAGESQNLYTNLLLHFRDGRSSRKLTVPPARITGPKFSPDERQVALVVAGNQNFDIWTIELESETMTRQTFIGDNTNAVWSSDGTELAFSSFRDGLGSAYAKPIDGSAEARLVYSGSDDASTGAVRPTDWTDQGMVLDVDDRNRTNIVVYSPDSEEVSPFLETPFAEGGASFSPDGKWILYSSDETGRSEIYVRSYPGPGGKRQISREGGFEPYWASGGREIVFRHDRWIWVTTVNTTGGFRVGQPEALFEIRTEIRTVDAYHTTRDGQTLVQVDRIDDEDSPGVTVVVNWLDELKRRVP